jgi:hypothetical protein
MATIAIHLSRALLCFSGHCYPALVGSDTPSGVFPAWHASTREAGYGGDVIAFARTGDGGVYAIHRVWTLRAQQRRLQRLASAHAEDRQGITGGCVNIAPAVYDALVAALDSASRVLITRDGAVAA